ncbi:MAG: type VII secretion protein EssC [Bacillota bacterium]|nr:type VII secretion protein EssC [Bacillota bacterium]
MATTEFNSTMTKVGANNNGKLPADSLDASDSTDASMQITLLSDTGTIKSMRLPYIPEGKYRFEGDGEQGVSSSVYIESKAGRWHACCTPPIYFIVPDGAGCHDVELHDRHLIPLGNTGSECVLYVEKINRESSVFHNYIVTKSSPISIGRADDNDIVYPNGLVSRHHALLSWSDNSWHILDCNSVNGVFVNDKKVFDTTLCTGDVVYILGLRLIIGTDFIAINDGNNRVSIASGKLKFVDSTFGIGTRPPEGAMENSGRLFNRLPRHKTALSPAEIVIEAPPMSLNSSKIPLLLRMGGSMVTSGVSAISGHYASLFSAILFPVLNQKYTEKEKKEYEALRLEKYGAYLDSKKEEIIREVYSEQEILNQNYPALMYVLNYPFTKTQLWERRKIDNDFLSMRLGSGSIPLLADVNYPKQRFDMNDDELEDRMYDLAETPVFLENVPIISSLLDNTVSGVTGDKEAVDEFAHRLIMQMAILHSYDEVKMVFLLEQEDLNAFEYIKYLPHTWDDQRTTRFVATKSSEAYQIGEYLKREIEDSLNEKCVLKDILNRRPYYVIFAMSKRIFDNLEILKDVMQNEDNCGVSVIALFDDLPKECSLLFNVVSDGECSVMYLNQPERSSETFIMDPYDPELARESMRVLANTDLKIVTQAYSLPKMLTFLEMFGVGRLEHLNPLKRWHDNNPVKSLSAPVGIATDGSPFCLDLHQKYQGPHGLVAGMTGSGKSEFLLTYILSMAVNYHPDEVAFVLIDYKGGGLAGAFDDPTRGIHLPHLVGTITNLDGSTIQRSIMSIQSELIRRQRIFNEVKNISDEGTMDIYKYQRLYRNKVVDEPMPHLFIISDEFAELKQQQPEFMENLISIARIGRSLGVHLILATQKPTGVVNDQIRSNTKFRVCLKVQDKSDSMDMLQRPEAAELKETGRFYLQVGYNELFALGQSAWSGADYFPQDEVVVQLDDSVQFIDSVGASTVEVKPQVDRGAACGAQLVTTVKLLSDIAEENGIKCRPLWKPALPAKLDIAKIYKLRDNKDNKVHANIGLLDDPNNQDQFTLDFDFSHCRNLMIIGDKGSGKTALIQSALYSLATNYSPEELNFYILDYSSRMLKVFSDLPHCGGVYFEEDTDLLENFFNLINSIVAERKRLFTALEVDSFDAACSIKKLPLVLVVIDNYAGLVSSKKGESIGYKLQGYIKDSVNYGVKYIISCSHTNEVNAKVKQELGNRICLHMKDKYDYGDALGCKVTYVPTEMPGRGIYNHEGAPLEFHAAMYQVLADDKQRIQLLKEELTSAAEHFDSFSKARRLPVVSETAEYTEFADQFKSERIPLGYSKADAKPVAMPLRQLSNLSVYLGNPEGNLPITKNFLYAAIRDHMEIIVVKRSTNSLFDTEEISDTVRRYKNISYINCEQAELGKLQNDIMATVAERQKLREKYCQEKGIDEKAPENEDELDRFIRMNTKPVIILFEKLADVSENLDMLTGMLFDQTLKVTGRYNIYSIAFFEPVDFENPMHGLFFGGYNMDGDAILFGGQFDKQTICHIPSDGKQLSAMLQYNIGMMKYREGYYLLLMPCGEITVEIPDEDKANIFSN